MDDELADFPKYVDLLLTGRALMDQGHNREAIAFFDLALDYEPNNPGAWWLKAVALMKCGPELFSIDKKDLLRWEAQCYEEALRLDPALTGVRFNLAGIRQDLNHYARAAELLQQIVDACQVTALEPEFTAAEFYTLLANVYSNTGDYARALNVVRLARENGVDSDELRRQEAWLSKLTAPNDELPVMRPFVLEATGGPLSKTFLEIGDLRELGLVEEMRTVLDDIRLRHGPTAAGESARYYEDLKRMIAKPDPVIPLIPLEQRIDTSSDVLCYWARAAIAEGDLIKSQQMLQDLNDTFPKDSCVKATQGYFFASQSRYEDALPFYAQAVELDPSNADAWFEYTDCLISLERSDEAREISSRGISNAPEPNRDLLIQQALLETPSKALGILFRLEHTCPGHDIKLYQAMLLTDLGRNDEAREILQKLNPEWFRGELAEKCRLLQRIHHIDLEEGQNDGA